MVSPLSVIRMGMSQIGHPRSGSYDTLNGDHPWAYWCESFRRSTHANLGLDEPAYWNAVSAGRAQDLQGGPPPLGACCYFDERFYSPDGHTGLSMGNGQLLGTLTDGTGVGLTWWNETTYGFMGWAYAEGVAMGARPPASPGTDPSPPSTFRPPDNPFETEAVPIIVIGHGFLRMWVEVQIGGDPYRVFGFPMDNEVAATIIDADGTSHDRTIQRFERAVMQFIPENEFPWNVTVVPVDAIIQ